MTDPQHRYMDEMTPDETRVLELILEQQKGTRQEVTEIKKSLIQLVRLDEKMVSHQEGMQRLGRRMDTGDKLMGSVLDRLQKLETMDKARGSVIAWVAGIVSAMAASGLVLWITSH